MNVGFFTVFRRDPQHYVCADLLVQSVRQSMPNVRIVHFTDDVSPAVPGVDEVRRLLGGKMLGLRMQHYAQCEGEWLLLDTDILVKKDVQYVFAFQFDICLADRNWPHVPADPKFNADMPWNTGVVFSRSPEFWKEVYQRWLALPEDQQDWLSEQRMVAQVLRENKYQLRQISGEAYNYPPDKTHRGEHAHILHFKGPRKALMKEFITYRPEVSAALELSAKPSDVTLHVYKNDQKQEDTGVSFKMSGIAPLRVFIGYDPRQPVAFHVAAHSVQSRSSVPVAITRLQLNQLPITRRGLTEFTYSRFLAPHLCGYEGWSIFLDADMLCLGDIAQLIAETPFNASVSVVKNQRTFEWASLMVFNNERCKNLTPSFISNPKNGLLDLKWADSIGALPADWNHLVGYDAPNPSAKLIHFTQGVPVWPETDGCEFAAEWHAEKYALLKSVSFAELMGNSVHVPHMKKAGA